MKVLFGVIALVFLLTCCGTTSGINSTGLDLDAPADVSGAWYRPSLEVTWQWQLEGTLNTSYDVEIYDVDLFDTSLVNIQAIQLAGKKVICYFSAGSYEEFREDHDQFPSDALGNTLDGWEDERWLDIRSTHVQSIMLARLDLAKQKGCDGVEPDNMDGYLNSTGFSLTSNDQLAYNRFIANAAHSRALSVGLKNDVDQVSELVDYFDFAVNEQCFEYSECDTLAPFVDNGKPVLNAEYLDTYITNTTARDALCTESRGLQFSTLILPLDLDDSFRFSCL
jgi:hypothetical protein